MNDKTEQTVTDALRRAFSLGQIYWQQADSEYISQHRRKADATRAKFQELCERTEDTIDNLRAQLAEAQRDAEVNKQINRACAELPDDFRIAIELEPNAACVYLLQEDEDIGSYDPCEGIASSISAAIDATKREKNGA